MYDAPVEREPIDKETLIDERRQLFRQNLAELPDDMAVVRRHVLHGAPFALDEEGSFALADEISTHWGVHPNRDVYLVGSAKLGFSINPKKRWLPFRNESDIDIAVVSERLFEIRWNEIDVYAGLPDSWEDRSACQRSVASGWIRPDYLPGAMADDWFEFFRRIQNTGTYAGGIGIRAGLYYSMEFLERYQARGVDQCRSEDS